MAEITLEHHIMDGIPFVRFEGDFTVSMFTALHLVVAGASRLGQLPVITDFSGNMTVSDELKRLKCEGLRKDMPDWTTRLVLVVVGSPERMEEIEALILPHQLQYASTVREAIEMLSKHSNEK